MCARFTLTLPDYDALARALGVDVDLAIAAFYRPRYNVAPTQVHLLLRAEHGKREVVRARWGLVNRWARAAGPKLINARSETAAVKPAFREAFARRRCVVPTDGFYEWTGEKGERQPIWLHPADGGLLRLAGLYESATEPATGVCEHTFTILTTESNALVAPIHDRMPAVLLPEDVDAWLDLPTAPSAANDEAARACLRPAPRSLLVATAVSSRVSSVRSDDPSCLAPAGPRLGETLPLFGRR